MEQRRRRRRRKMDAEGGRGRITERKACANALVHETIEMKVTSDASTNTV